MNNYNPNIHHRKSIRMKGYDYSQAGLYFITICCHKHKFLFGNITSNHQKTTGCQTPVMLLNDAGKIANNCWLEIPQHFPNVILHEYIIMPNHVHGIIELTPQKTTTGTENYPARTDFLVSDFGANDIGANNHSPLFRSPSKTIGSIVRGYKIGVTKWFRQNTAVKNVWQRNYYDNIIFNQQAYQRISEYIVNNPAKWVVDKFYLK
jgi:putative transposase